MNRGRSSFLIRVNRGRTSGAGRRARRSFAGWALVAPARQGGELAPCGRSDSAALPPRLRSSHPAEFALGHAPRARGPSPLRGRPDLSGGRVRLVRVYVRNQAAGAYQCATSPRICPESGRRRGPVTTRPRACPESGLWRGPVHAIRSEVRPLCTWMCNEDRPCCTCEDGPRFWLNVRDTPFIALRGRKGVSLVLIDGLGRLLLLRERGGRAWRAARAWRCRRRSRSTWRPEP